MILTIGEVKINNISVVVKLYSYYATYKYNVNGFKFVLKFETL